MTTAFRSPPLAGSAALSRIVVEAVRCWTERRAQEAPVQPGLFALLSRTGHGLLAPVLDSLFALFSAGLGRPLGHGDNAALSADESLLLGLLTGAMRRRECLDCATGVGSALDCALCSTRIMLALGVGTPVGEREALALP